MPGSILGSGDTAIGLPNSVILFYKTSTSKFKVWKALICERTHSMFLTEVLWPLKTKIF